MYVADLFGAMQYALMDFYFGNPLSVLCWESNDDDNSSEMAVAVSALTADHVHLLRSLNSFRTHLERQFQLATEQPDDAAPSSALTLDDIETLLTDDDAVKARIPGWLADLRTYQVRFNTALLCLFHLQNQSKLSRRSLRYLYSLALDRNIMADEHIKLMLLLLKCVCYCTGFCASS